MLVEVLSILERYVERVESDSSIVELLKRSTTVTKAIQECFPSRLPSANISLVFVCV